MPLFARTQVGEVIAGKYRVERVLGVGGMGIVVAARHLELDELRAIKLLHPAELGNAQSVARFGREARAIARLRSEHVARIHDAGRLENGIPYIVLEHLEGSDLHKLGKQRGRFSVGDAVLYVLQACDAVAEAHAAGTVHRDLKPANLFLTQRRDGSPCIKVLDFGISKHLGKGRFQSSWTRTEDILGSPLYMSPEQMRSTRDVDTRTDIWALGAILYRLLAGESPFAATSVADVYANILEREPRALTSVRSDIPHGLAQAIQRCLHKDREQRMQSAIELMAALAPYAPDEEAPRSARAAGRYIRVAAAPRPPVLSFPQMLLPDETPTLVPSERTPPAWGRTENRARQPPRTLAGAALLSAAGMTMGLLLAAAGFSNTVRAASGLPVCAPPPVPMARTFSPLLYPQAASAAPPAVVTGRAVPEHGRDR